MAATQLKQKDVISFSETLNISLEKYDKLNTKLKNKDLLNLLYGINKDIIRKVYEYKSNDTYALLINNLIDKNDTEPSIIIFSQVVSQSHEKTVVLCMKKEETESTLSNLRNILGDDVELINFNKFEIEFSPASVKFSIEFDKNRYPTYVKKMIEKYFKQIFDKFAYHCQNDPLFLL